ncbi:MAG: hypothetical protein U0R76_10885 [Candidatus Nanopelagicales bacterium]
MTSSNDVLRLIADGNKLQAIADLTGFPRGYIVQTARENGYGLNVSSDRFQKVVVSKPAPQGIVRPTPPPPPPGPTVTTTATAVRPAVRDILDEAKTAGGNLRKAAERIERDLDKLADLTRANRANTEARKREEAEKAAARQKIAELEEQLREAKAALRRKPTTNAQIAKDAGTAADRAKGAKPPIGVDYRALDAWCQETGRPWRKQGMGRPSNALIAEFRAATEEGAA